MSVPEAPDDAIESRRKAAALPTLREVYRYNASQADAAAALAVRRYEALLEQRDRLTERMRFGVLSLNAASLIALAALIGDKAKLAQLGLSPKIVVVSAVFFVVGSVMSAIAIRMAAIHMTTQAPVASQRVLDSRALVALVDSSCSMQAEEDFQKALAARTDKVDPDYAWSFAVINVTSWAEGCWLGGVSAILGSMIIGLF